MKKIFAPISIMMFFLFGMLILPYEAQSQCTNCISNYPTGTKSTTSATWALITNYQEDDEYSYYTLNSNYMYQWKTAYYSSDGAFDTELTLYPSATCGSGYHLAYDDDGGAGTYSCVNYSGTVTSVRLLCSYYNCTTTSGRRIQDHWRAIPKTPTISGGGVTICTGGSATLTASNIGNNDNYVSVYWGTTSGGTQTSSDATSVTVSPTSTTTYYLRYVLTDYDGGAGNSGKKYSNVTSTVVTVVPDPTVSISATNTSVCVGGSVVLSSSVSNGTGSAAYQWQKNNVNISGATSSTYTVPTSATSYAGTYRCRYYRSGSGCGYAYSSGIAISIAADVIAPTITRTPNSSPVCQGTSLDISASGGSGGAGTIQNQYQYYNGSWSGWSTSAPSFSAAYGVTNYYKSRRYASGNGCGYSAEKTVSWTVDATSNAGTMSVTNSSICVGGSTVFAANGTVGFDEMEYQWDGTGGTWSSWGTSNPHNWSTTGNAGRTLYVRSQASNGVCSVVYSAPVSVTIVADPVAPTITRAPNTSPVCQGTSLDITEAGGSGGCGTITNQYRYNNGSWSSWSTSTPAYTATPGTNYYESRRIATGNGCNDSPSNQVSWSVDANPTAGTVSTSTNSACPGDGVTFDAIGYSGTFETFEYKWNAGGATTDWVNTDPYTWTASNPGNSLYVRSRIGNGVCSDVYSPWSSGVVVNTESTTPTGVSITNNNTCNGTSKTLSVTGGNLGTGASWHWYTSSCGGTAAGTGSSITVNPSAGSSTTYYVRAEGTCNTTSCASGTVVVNSVSTTPTGVSITNNNTCNGTSKTLSVTGGSLGTGASWHWYTGACGGTAAGTGSSITVNPSAGTSTTYYVRAEGTCNTTSCTSGTVVVNSVSTTPTGVSISNNNTCNGTNKTLSVTGGSLGTGATWHWYTGSCGGASVGTGNSITVNPLAGSSTTYYVRAEGTCNTTACASGTVVVNSVSTTPTGVSITNNNTCNGTSKTLSVTGGNLGTGATWHWYTGSCGGTAAGTGSSITVNPSAGSSTTYYVRAEGTCNTTSCASGTLTVTPNASIASVSGTSPLCIGETDNYTANSVVLGGGSGAWSSSNTSVATVNSSGVVTAVSAGTCNITYSITGGCNGNPSASKSLTVTPNASIASVSGTSPLCIGGTDSYSANSVVLGGGSGAWSSSNTSVATVNSSGVVTAVSAGTCNITYSITGGCNGNPSASKSLTVTPNASIASVSGTSPLCIGGTDSYSANSVVLGGGTGAWSSSNTSVATVNSSGVVTTLAAGTSNITYAITGGCNGTASASKTVTVTPDASIASVSGTSPLCIGGTDSYSANSVVLGGGSGAWSSSNTSVATVNSSGVVTAVSAGTCNITYSITGGCNGNPSASKLLTVTPNASIASVSGTSPLCIGETDNYTANSVVLGGGSGAWSSSNTSVATVNSSGVVTAVSAGTCNITYSITGGCNSTPSASKSLTVTPNASIASVSGTSPLCIGETDNYSTNSVVLGGGTGAWSSSNTSVATVNSSGVVTTLAAGNCDITYTITGGCNGTASASKTVTVNPNASIASVSGTSPLCIGETDNYSANSVVLGGGSGVWSSSNTSVATVNSSGVVTAVSAGTCNITYSITGGCNCTPSASKSLTVNPDLPVSISIAASENPTCAGVSETFTATPTNGGTPSYQWKLNGSDVGGNSDTYINSELANTDQVTCEVTSTATCATGNPATSNTITMSVNTPATTGLTNGDYVWSGNTSNDWETTSNWLIYDGTNYSTALSIPDDTKNVFLRAYAPCASNSANTNASSAVSCNDLTIETGLTIGNISQLSVKGNWTNNGTFSAGTGKVNFTGTSPQTIFSNGDPFYDITFNNTCSELENIILSDNLNISNSATFTNGVVKANFHSVILENGSTSNAGNANSFVSGEISHTGTSAFVYPIGDVENIGGADRRIWAPIETDACAISTITAQYHYENPPYDWWYHGGNMDNSIDHVSDREYWDLTTSNAHPAVTLYWTSNTDDLHSFGTTDHTEMTSTFVTQNMTIAHYNVAQNKWNNMGTSVPSTIYFDDGKLKTTAIFSNYSPITFASKRSDFQLPVELISFTATCNSGNALLEWTTASETNNDYFNIERSTDGKSWETIAKINGSGDSNSNQQYSYFDTENLSTKTYYRLSQVDFNGEFEYFDIIEIDCSANIENPKVTIYPNPFNLELNLLLENWIDNASEINILDVNGRLIENFKIEFTESDFHKRIITDDYAPGTYIIQIITDDEIFNFKIEKM